MNQEGSLDQVSAVVTLFFAEKAMEAVAVKHRYALVDPAQDEQLLGALRGLRTRCLLGDTSAVRKVSPHLVELPSSVEPAHTWKILARYGSKKPCLVLLGSDLNFDGLFAHLALFLEVQVNRSTTMLLAWWDPSVLASLLGQPDDETLYEKGPILDAAQRRALLAPLRTIGYWDRRGCLRQIGVEQLDEMAPAHEKASDASPVLPLSFTAEQVRLLVKATTPDQVLYELRLNQPGVLLDRSEWENYRMTCGLVDAAHGYDIRGLQDLVNFTGAGMILGERFYRFPPIEQALVAVKAGQQSFTEMLKSLSPDVLEDARAWATQDDK